MKIPTQLIFVIAFSHFSMALAIAAPASEAKAQKWKVSLDQGSGAIEFNAIGRPSLLKIRGKGGAPKGAFTLAGQEVEGEATFQLESLDTGIKLRNEHLKTKYLEIEKFPSARLVFSSLKLPKELASEGALERVPFEGTLSLHGVEKPVKGLADIRRSANTVEVSADFGIKIGDFGIAVPKYAGITVAEDVQVAVKFAAPVAQ